MRSIVALVQGVGGTVAQAGLDNRSGCCDMNERSLAVTYGLRKVDYLFEREPRASAEKWSIDEFADEGAVKREPSRIGKDC
jgi:hypothetical protein